MLSSADLREAVLGQNTVCPSQLKDAVHRGIKKLRMLVDFADYADEVHSYTWMSRRQRFAKRSLAHQVHLGLFPRHASSSATPACNSFHFPECIFIQEEIVS